ncbi:MAG: D-isomer specific 2-hydroxyacid dehydrogenase NAD-binding protein [Candidatus Magasanikbacteria bacterium GW2011_GWC2_34_16]|uniref:D-isomer specific 2-hydroxyacid dehydrogenase NAD-binding protein n=2 Tax=Candidatus Magasanikiibacteriota TaxID=1752731 RepID=A0A0G0KKW4_9BACT|nr:MAG: D-isomer specific 2-hydroxyacid dehydrogenase NAD-binding protein [Candidatus Magasanikbacteria bacterium GW2011_GWC2_34_16]KKQ41226.1 MAG: D-isomer specific 2-hydroxyacid dehydrogenase NAD-binding protein [Candidatus Magasanikbacteria bacterium GW2011_GWA2_37_8]
MSAPKLNVAFYGIWPEMKDYVRSKMSGFHCTISGKKVSVENLKPETDILAVFVESPVTKSMINKLPKLKMIAAMSTGYDHVDIKTAKIKKIPICNVPSYGENTVAEHAFALLLGLTRKLFLSVKRVKEGVYDFHGLRGIDLKGKTIGVIGTGRIGMHVVEIAKGFEMNVLGFDPFPNKEMAKKLDFTYVSLNKLLAQSDFISLHTPLFPETYHLINKKNIKKVKPGAYIINTARGGLIDPEALVWALQSKHIAGAGLDVLEDEGFIQNEEQVISGDCTECQMKTNLMNNIIIDHPNTIVTPHNAFNSTEALRRIVDTTIENIRAFVKGETINDVTAPKKK